MGDSSCGKTSLVLRFDQNVFSTKFVTTIGVDYRDKMVKVRFIVALAPEFVVSMSQFYVMFMCHAQISLFTSVFRLKGHQ